MAALNKEKVDEEVFGEEMAFNKPRRHWKIKAQLWFFEKATLFQMVALLSTEPLMYKITGAKKETKGYLEDW